MRYPLSPLSAQGSYEDLKQSPSLPVDKSSRDRLAAGGSDTVANGLVEGTSRFAESLRPGYSWPCQTEEVDEQRLQDANLL